MQKISLYITAVLWLFFSACCSKKSIQGSMPSNTDTQNPDTSNNLYHRVTINGCATTTTKGHVLIAEKSELSVLKLPGNPEIPVIIAQGDSIIYTRETEHLCCREVSISTDSDAKNIHINEFWKHQGCKCKCSSNLRVVLPKIAKGTYMVYAIVKETDPVTDIYHGFPDTIKIQQITIR